MKGTRVHLTHSASRLTLRSGRTAHPYCRLQEIRLCEDGPSTGRRLTPSWWLVYEKYAVWDSTEPNFRFESSTTTTTLTPAGSTGYATYTFLQEVGSM